jgi:hypothetical protein
MLGSTFDSTTVRGLRPLTGSFDPNSGLLTLLVVKSFLVFTYFGSEKNILLLHTKPRFFPFSKVFYFVQFLSISILFPLRVFSELLRELILSGEKLRKELPLQGK